MDPPDGPFAVVLGAGWGCAVGLPAASNLMSLPVLVPKKGARRRMESVLSAFDEWSSANPELKSEQFLTAVFEREVTIPVAGEQIAMEFAEVDTAGWRAAVEFVALRIATSVRPDATELAPAVIEVD